MNRYISVICILLFLGVGGTATGESAKIAALPVHDPSQIKVMSNIHHNIRNYSLSADERFLFAAGDDEVSVWDVATGKIIKSYPMQGVLSVKAHRTNPSWLIVSLDTENFTREPLMIIDWMAGRIAGHQFNSEISDESLVEPLYRARIVRNRIKNRAEDFGMRPLKIWGVEVSPSDSLLLTGGMRPVLYDIYNMRPQSHIPYLEYMMATDSTLNYDRFNYMPKSKEWKGSVESAFYNRFCFDTHFSDSSTIVMGGATPVITRWNTDGQIIGAEEIPMMRKGPVFDVSSASDNSIVGTLYGTMHYDDDNGWRLLTDAVQTGKGFAEALMTTKVSKPFGSPGQEKVIVSLVHGPQPRHQLIDMTTGETVCVSNDPGWGNINDIDVKVDGTGAIAVNEYDAALLDWTGNKLIRIIPLGVDKCGDQFLESCIILPEGTYAFGTDGGNIIFSDASGRVLRRVESGNGAVCDLALDHARRRLYAMHNNDCVSIWNLDDGSLIVTLYYFSTDGVMAVTPDHFYTVSPELNGLVHFTKDNRVYSFSQFDMRNNRPDIVLERLGGDPEKVEMLHKAWLKRLNRSGLTPEMLADDYHVPEVAIVESELMPDRVNSSCISFDVEMFDSQEEIRDLEVSLNGVIVYRLKDMVLAPGVSHRHGISLDLASGVNNVGVTVRNRRGTSSLKAEYQVENESPVLHRNLYAVCIGVSEYESPGYSLGYAAKDAADVALLLRNRCNEFDNVNTLLIADEDFSSSSLDRIRQFVASAGRDDAVLLFFAGHGVVDSSLDYYLAPYNMDFALPSLHGIGVDELTGTITDTRALKRYIIIDACHSGRIDKEDYIAANVASISAGDSGVVFRGAESLKFRSREVEAVNRLIETHFDDFNEPTGAMIASSASGMEVAVESQEWQNGIFTYHLINGLEMKGSGIAADADADGHATMEELLRYAADMVPRTTSGAQNPTIRNLDSTSLPLVITTAK